MAERDARETAYFTETNSAEIVIGRMGSTTDPRLHEIVSAVIRHLHALVKEVEPTQQEWMEAIHFLTETGHMCSEWRQEFILLSDTLGVSMLVDAINNRKPSGATESTVLGPFHVADAPHYENGADIRLDGKGERLVVSGQVTDTTGKPIASATLDIWQANDEGFYDVQQKDLQPAMNLRGLFTTDADGHYWFRTAKPRYYPIPDDGPVGKLLRQTGRHPYRPAHVHFIVAAEGYEPVVTHIFPPDCPYLESDAVFGVKQSLIGDFRRIDDAARAKQRGVEAPFWELKADFVLAIKHPLPRGEGAAKGGG